MKRIKMQLFAIELCALLLLVLISSFFFNRLLLLSQEKQESYLRNSLTQAAQGVETVLHDIEGSMSNYAYSDAVQGLLRAPARSSEMLGYFSAAKSGANTIASINKNIEGIALIPPEGMYYSFGLKDQYLYIRSARNALGQVRAAAFDGDLDNAHGDSSAYFTYVLPVYSVAQGPGQVLGEYLGVCVAFCKKQALLDVVDAALMEGMSIEVRSGAKRVLLSQWKAPEGASTTVNTYAFDTSSWWMIQRFTGPRRSSPYPMILGASILISLGVLMMLSFIVRRNFTLPITRINQELLQIAQHPLEQNELTARYPNELNTIAQSVNTLLFQLRASHRQQVEQKNHMLRVRLSMNQLQLSLLQNQINPHFLYNTLACIRGIALSHGVRVIADIVTNMATLYRYSIKGGAFVRLKDEADIVLRYLNIMNLRMDNKFQIQVEIPDALMESWVCKMILQPLVENAIFHGLECKEEGGLLRLSAAHFPGDSAFLLHVYDNGIGMDEGTVRRLNDLFNRPVSEKSAGSEELNAKGMGLLNVHRKVRLMHGDAYGLHVESAQGSHTRVSILLPLLPKQPQGQRQEN